MKIAILTTDNREPYRQYDNPTPWFGTAPEALLQGFAQLPEAEVHIVSCTQQPMISSPEKLAPNIFFHSLHVPKIGWGRTLFQGCVRASRKKLREIQPEIVHGQGTERDCALSAVFSGYPNVLTIHGNMRLVANVEKAMYWKLAARLEAFAIPRSAGVVCISNYTRGAVKDLAKKTWVVPNALRQEFFEPIPNGRRSGALLNVGVICQRKRQLELLSVVENLYRRDLKFEFHFIGDAFTGSSYANAFLEKLKPLETAGCARYSDRLTTTELINRFDSASGFVHFPSEEAFGLVVAESMARGLKFFGACIGGVADIVGGVSEAELFDVGDWDGLTEAIAGWIKNGNPIAPAAAQLMRQRYYPTVIANRHLEIYREVLNTRS